VTQNGQKQLRYLCIEFSMVLLLFCRSLFFCSVAYSNVLLQLPVIWEHNKMSMLNLLASLIKVINCIFMHYKGWRLH
jgi:hypothetical protein